ncbi:proline-serine-threonine phosphatase-interacting protein 2-like [Actinia tenebrosa]|uniref:Proline-serine-threonine phosphatase-interacting protein 2-like n=1 Tax=Actinia tenebrosa TaxID=6105 RepID=A0A6P8IJN9_ACTTE|nr:proline-serine-threonine phosphatase-interacting protein 2-like [Actinia tenebrosa]
MTRFVDCFWGSDFTSTAGFDNLCKRLRDGKQSCQDFEEFVRQRADIEEKYGKSLTRLAKSNEAKEEIGSLKDSWDCLRNETENVGKAHIALAQQLLDDLEKAMREFRETQRAKRKQVEEVVKKAQRNKKNHYDNTIKLKRSYEQKCKDHDAADDCLKRSVSTASKDEEKHRARLGKAKTAVEQSGKTGLSTILSNNVIFPFFVWIVFQSLEEERIAYLRNAMWIYTNLGSTTCVKVDEIYEEMRKSLENCDVDMDVKLFISMKRTGSEKPEHIEYENYYMTQSSQRTTPLTTGPVSIGAPVQSHSNAPAILRSRRPAAALPSIPTSSTAVPEAPDLYSSIEEARHAPKLVSSTSRAKERICVALYDYDAQGEQELTFKKDDHIRLLYTEGDVWCCGVLGDKRGMFPKTFVKMQQ